MSTAVLARAGIATEVCPTLDELVREIDRGAGALLVSEEMLSGDGAEALARAVSAQRPGPTCRC